MELIDSYLEKIKKVKGIYVLKLQEPIGKDELMAFVEEWKQTKKEYGIEEPILIVPKEVELDYEKTFDFKRAMQVLDVGAKVKREAWNENTYLFRDHEQVKIVEDGEVYHYLVNMTDVLAEDWILYKGD